MQNLLHQLIAAIRNEDLTSVQQLVPQVRTINAVVEGRRVLADAIQAKNVDILKAVLTAAELDLSLPVASFESFASDADCLSLKRIKKMKEKTIDHSITALFMALELGSVDKVKLLIESGASQDSKTPNTDMNLFMAACKYKDLQMVKELNKFIAEFNHKAVNKHGKTALDYLFEMPSQPDYWYCTDEFKVALKAPLNCSEFLQLFKYAFQKLGFKTFGDKKANIWLRLMDYADKNKYDMLQVVKTLKSMNFPKYTNDPKFNGMNPCMFALKIGNIELFKQIMVKSKQDCTDFDGNSVFNYFLDNSSLKEKDFEVLDGFKMSKKSFLIYLNSNNAPKSIKLYDAIIKKYPEFEEAAKKHFESVGWVQFFGFFRDLESGDLCTFVKKHLKPLLQDDVLFESFFKTLLKISPKILLQTFVSKLGESDERDFIDHLISKRKILARICFCSSSRKNYDFLSTYWNARVENDSELVLEGFANCSLCTEFIDGYVSLTEEQKSQALCNLEHDCAVCLAKIISKATNQNVSHIPLHLFLQKGFIKCALYLVKNENHTDEQLLEALKIQTTLKIQSSEKMQTNLKMEASQNKELRKLIISKISDPLSCDSEEKCLLNYQLLSKALMKTLKGREGEVVAKLSSDETVFKCQTLTTERRLKLFVVLIKKIPLADFKTFLTCLPVNYFEEKVVKPFGTYLLCKAQKFKMVQFLIKDCQVPANGRVKCLQGSFSPLACAIAKKNFRKATSLLFSGASFDNLYFGNVLLESYILKKKIKLPLFWIRRIFTSKSAIVHLLESEVIAKNESGALLLLKFPQISQFLLESDRYIHILASAVYQHLTPIVVQLMKINLNFELILPNLNQNIIEYLCIYDREGILKELKLLGLTSDVVYKRFGYRKTWLCKIFPDIRMRRFFESSSFIRYDQLNKSDVLSCFDKCSICKSDYEAEDTVLVLKCKHLFHSECLGPTIKCDSDEFDCPYCRHNHFII